MSRYYAVSLRRTGTTRSSWRASTCLLGALCGLALLLSGMPPAGAQAPQRNLGADVYTSAGDISSTAAVSGDAFVAGGRVALTGTVDGDAVVAGGSILLGSSVGQDVYAAGGEIRIAQTIGGNARLAGGRITLEPEAVVEGSLTAFGGNVTLNGAVGGYALISAGRAEVNGRIAGDLQVVGGALTVGPTAVIQGRLDYRGAQPAAIAPGARIDGGVAQPAAEKAAGSSAGLHLIWLIGLILVSAIWLGAAPRVSRAVAQVLRSRPLAAPLLGLALFVGLPVMGSLLMLTVVGLPVGALALSAWLTLGLLGFFATAIALGDAMTERSGPARRAKRMGAAALAVLILYALGQIPYAGWLVWGLAILAGMGGIVLTAWGKLRPVRSV